MGFPNLSEDHATLFKSKDVLIRLMTLRPREVGEKHHHSRLFETVICVEGEVALHVDGVTQPQVLSTGQQASVPALTTHWLENVRDLPARYILAQNGGDYDFIRVGSRVPFRDGSDPSNSEPQAS